MARALPPESKPTARATQGTANDGLYTPYARKGGVAHPVRRSKTTEHHTSGTGTLARHAHPGRRRHARVVVGHPVAPAHRAVDTWTNIRPRLTAPRRVTAHPRTVLPDPTIPVATAAARARTLPLARHTHTGHRRHARVVVGHPVAPAHRVVLPCTGLRPRLTAPRRVAAHPRTVLQAAAFPVVDTASRAGVHATSAAPRASVHGTSAAPRATIRAGVHATSATAPRASVHATSAAPRATIRAGVHATSATAASRTSIPSPTGRPAHQSQAQQHAPNYTPTPLRHRHDLTSRHRPIDSTSMARGSPRYTPPHTLRIHHF